MNEGQEGEHEQGLGRSLKVDLTSVEISKSLLELLRSLDEDDLEGFLDALRFKVAKSADRNTASFAPDDSGVAMVVLNGEDGTSTVLTLEIEAV